jgi:lysozyme family protein
MSADNFDKALDFVLKWEGADGQVTVDTGGTTKYGISSRAYPTLDIPNLTLEQAKLIYRQDYWDEAQCNSVSWPWDIILLDTSVNVGVTQCMNWFNNSENWQDLLLRRVLHYVTLARKPKYQPYLRGWLNRTMNLFEVIG